MTPDPSLQSDVNAGVLIHAAAYFCRRWEITLVPRTELHPIFLKLFLQFDKTICQAQAVSSNVFAACSSLL